MYSDYDPDEQCEIVDEDPKALVWRDGPLEVTKPSNREIRNARLYYVLNIIRRHPGMWNQDTWHCGTSHCVGGFAQMLARRIPLTTVIPHPFILVPNPLPNMEGLVEVFADEEGALWLGLDKRQMNQLFHPANRFETLVRIIHCICDTEYHPEEVVSYGC